MRILITGNMGYVGAAVARDLRQHFPTAELIGFDSAYYAHCLTAANRIPESFLNRQHFGDLRDFPGPLLDGVDAVIHLAAVSNDPMGNRFEEVTEEINFRASVRLAELAVSRGVGHFAFASSCSVYGAAGQHDCNISPLRYGLRDVRPSSLGFGSQRLCRLRHRKWRNHGSERRDTLASPDRRAGHGDRASLGDYPV